MKFIVVNMSEKAIHVEDVPDEYKGLGGRGLTSIMINAEVPPTCDPLGPDNKLIIAPGLLSGTTLPNTSRISIGAKSPLTGGIKESNAGGTVAAALGHLGITANIGEGQAPQGELSLLMVDENGDANVAPAQEFSKMRTYQLVETLLEVYGEKNSILCIGPAGEHLMKIASVQSSDADGHPSRSAGRGGMGAVMGAKGLKAIVVSREGKNADPIADPEAFKAATKEVIEIVLADHMNAEVMPKLGTAGLVAPVNAMGAFPSYNARKGTLEGWEKISGETMAETIKERGGNPTHRGCDQCIIHCSNVFVDEKGKYVTSALEYETIWAMGGMTGTPNMDMIARLDFMCDDIGIDTMSTGVAVAVAMDSGYKEFGDAQAVIDLVEEIGQATEFGKILGSGPAEVGKHFNNEHVPVIKGQSIAGYDPRAMLGHGVTYATSPMGGDHTSGNLVGAYLEKMLDPLDPKGQVDESRFLQIVMAAFDTMGQCFMANVALLSPESLESFSKVINAKVGTQLAPKEFPFALGTRVLKAEREFNKKAGFTEEDDRLPRFFRKEPLPPHNTVFSISDEEIDSTFDF